MAESDTVPDVESIVSEIREGMADVQPAVSPDPGMAARHDLRGSIRIASATRDALGSCGSGLRGSVCRMFAKCLLPMVQQLNAHNAAVATALKRLADDSGEKGDENSPAERLTRLEAEVAALKEREQA